MLSDNTLNVVVPEMLSDNTLDCAMGDCDEDPELLSNNILDCAKAGLFNFVGGSLINAECSGGALRLHSGR